MLKGIHHTKYAYRHLIDEHLFLFCASAHNTESFPDPKSCAHAPVAPSTAPPLSPEQVENVREFVMVMMNWLSDTHEKSEETYASLTKLRARVGESVDDTIRLSLMKIAMGASITSRVGDFEVDQISRFCSMINESWN
jgi:hypothetical protein